MMKSMFRSIIVIGLAAAASFAVAVAAVPISPPAALPTFMAFVPVVVAAMAIAALVVRLVLDPAGAARAALVRIRNYRERILQRKPYLLTV